MAIAFDKRSVGHRFRVLRGRTASEEGSRVEAELKIEFRTAMQAQASS
jgi:hypothetical protein